MRLLVALPVRSSQRLTGVFVLETDTKQNCFITEERAETSVISTPSTFVLLGGLGLGLCKWVCFLYWVMLRSPWRQCDGVSSVPG